MMKIILDDFDDEVIGGDFILLLNKIKYISESL